MLTKKTLPINEEKDYSYEECKMFAMAIIEQACIDYNNILLNKNVHYIPATTNRVSLEKFFEGDWFKVLSEGKLDGPSIARRLRENALNGQGTKIAKFYML